MIIGARKLHLRCQFIKLSRVSSEPPFLLAVETKADGGELPGMMKLRQLPYPGDPCIGSRLLVLGPYVDVGTM